MTLLDGIWIDSGYFFAGVVLNETRYVERYAPILKYMSGWSEKEVVDYIRKRRWKYGYV